MTRLRDNSGQAAFLPIVFMTVLLGMCALVLDVGSWFRADRAAQQAADAAALAGAQALPEDTGKADALARAYADKNDGGLSAINFSSKHYPADTISVKVDREAPGFFAKIFGIDSVAVGATAAARAGNLDAARWAAPIAVDKKHPLLSGANCPCFNQPTELDLEKVGPGAFRLLNLDDSFGGTGQKITADWILKGFDGMLNLGEYYSNSGAKFNSSEIKAALDIRIGTELLFPVYDLITGQGSNVEYRIIGFVGFRVTSYTAQGDGGQLFGHFTKVIWEGIQNEKSSAENFGAKTIALVD